MAHIGILEAARPPLQLLAMEGIGVMVDDDVGVALGWSKPLDVGPIGFTGWSYKSNFLLPNICLTRFQASRGSFGTLFEILKHKHSRLEYS